MSQQCALVARKANSTLGCIRVQPADQGKSHPEAQRAGAFARLKEMALFSLTKRRLRGVLIAIYSYLIRDYREDQDNLFSEHKGRLKNDKHKLEHQKFRPDIRTTFLITRVIKHWNRLPREVLTNNHNITKCTQECTGHSVQVSVEPSSRSNRTHNQINQKPQPMYKNGIVRPRNDNSALLIADLGADTRSPPPAARSECSNKNLQESQDFPSHVGARWDPAQQRGAASDCSKLRSAATSSQGLFQQLGLARVHKWFKYRSCLASATSQACSPHERQSERVLRGPGSRGSAQCAGSGLLQESHLLMPPRLSWQSSETMKGSIPEWGRKEGREEGR
ncbi:LOW QUALITY PROTEIN: hypothetical protein QYF61_026664, partial [Mycteria americana]